MNQKSVQKTSRQSFCLCLLGKAYAKREHVRISAISSRIFQLLHFSSCMDKKEPRKTVIKSMIVLKKHPYLAEKKHFFEVVGGFRYRKWLWFCMSISDGCTFHEYNALIAKVSGDENKSSTVCRKSVFRNDRLLKPETCFIGKVLVYVDKIKTFPKASINNAFSVSLVLLYLLLKFRDYLMNQSYILVEQLRVSTSEVPNGLVKIDLGS